MAVGSQKLAGPRTPLPDGQLKDESQKDDSLSDMEEDPNQIVQVPSSIPHSEQQDAGLYEGDKEEFQTNDQVREAKDARSNDPADIKEDEPRTEEEADANEGIDLEAMDWLAFQAEYMKALKSADEEENALIEEFERLSTAFALWAEASGEYDNTRAVKRLKTRERFVRLSEEKLEEKKKHYVEVVDAFKKALALLSG